jgi:hypothetical protein
VVVAVLAIVGALAVGLRGLGGNPVRGTDAAGVTTISGSWEPYSCDGSACQGYVQDGGRSVFVRFPHCPSSGYPARNQQLTLRARRDPALGTAAYDALSCLVAP